MVIKVSVFSVLGFGMVNFSFRHFFFHSFEPSRMTIVFFDPCRFCKNVKYFQQSTVKKLPICLVHVHGHKTWVKNTFKSFYDTNECFISFTLLKLPLLTIFCHSDMVARLQFFLTKNVKRTDFFCLLVFLVDCLSYFYDYCYLKLC